MTASRERGSSCWVFVFCAFSLVIPVLCEKHTSTLDQVKDLTPTHHRRRNEASGLNFTTPSLNVTSDINCSTSFASICPDKQSACNVAENGNNEASLWYVGVILSIVSSILSNFGVNVQKYSFNFEGIKPKAEQRSYVLQPFWVGGLVMIVIGAVGDFIALGFAAQSLVTPVGGATMVANVFFAYFWLGENLSVRDVVATLTIIGGILIITIFGNKEEACYTVQELMDMYTTDAFVIYACGFVTAMVLVFMVTTQAEKKRSKYGPSSPRYIKMWQKIHRFGYPCLSGMVGAQDVLFAKSVAELIKSSFKGTNQFVYFEAWVLLFLMVATILMQLHFLAKGLEKFDAVYIIPVFQCFFISGSILCGAIYFKEFDEFTLTQTISFTIGMLVTMFGVVVLSARGAGVRITPLRRFRSAVYAVIYLRRYYHEDESCGGVNLWTHYRPLGSNKSSVVPFSSKNLPPTLTKHGSNDIVPMTIDSGALQPMAAADSTTRRGGGTDQVTSHDALAVGSASPIAPFGSAVQTHSQSRLIRRPLGLSLRARVTRAMDALFGLSHVNSRVYPQLAPIESSSTATAARK